MPCLSSPWQPPVQPVAMTTCLFPCMQIFLHFLISIPPLYLLIPSHAFILIVHFTSQGIYSLFLWAIIAGLMAQLSAQDIGQNNCILDRIGINSLRSKHMVDNIFRWNSLYFYWNFTKVCPSSVIWRIITYPSKMVHLFFSTQNTPENWLNIMSADELADVTQQWRISISFLYVDLLQLSHMYTAEVPWIYLRLTWNCWILGITFAW